MIFGIGTDIIEIERFENVSDSFMDKVYTKREIKCFKAKTRSLAGNFAVKEAVAKALGTGFSGFSPRDIEVLRDRKGKPYVILYNGALELFKNKSLKIIHVSVSHSRTAATAFAVAEGE